MLWRDSAEPPGEHKRAWLSAADPQSDDYCEAMESGRHANGISGSPARAASTVVLLSLLALSVIPTVILYGDLVASIWHGDEFSKVGKAVILGLPLIPALYTSTRRSLHDLIAAAFLTLLATLIVVVMGVWYSFNTGTIG